MVAIWAKTIFDEKITRSIVYRREGRFDVDDFMDYVINVCYELDIPTPVVTTVNGRNFALFNITRFKRQEFMDEVDFDMLVLENAVE